MEVKKNLDRQARAAKGFVCQGAPDHQKSAKPSIPEPVTAYNPAATYINRQAWRQSQKETEMQGKFTALLGGLFVMGAVGMGSPLHAQSMEVKEKPALYSYVANWQMPRAKWTEFEKPNAASDKLLSQALGSGALVAYGADKIEVHSAEGPTHDSFWSAMSMAGLLDMLDSLSKGPPNPLLQSATKHWDGIYVSRFYNWKSGTYKDAYTHTSYYKLKATAPDDAVETVSKNFIVPLMEKLLADGSIVEYEVDKEAIHTESPAGFWVDYITPNSAGLDKVNAALGQAIKTNTFAGPAFDAMVDSADHRDYLSRSSVTYK